MYNRMRRLIVRHFIMNQHLVPSTCYHKKLHLKEFYLDFIFDVQNLDGNRNTDRFS